MSAELSDERDDELDDGRVAEVVSAGNVTAATGRYRVSRSPARTRVVKVLYAEDEFGAVAQAAGRAGLRPSSYVAGAALATASGMSPAGAGAGDRELLAELVQGRLALRRYASALTQLAEGVRLSDLAEVPALLTAAVAVAERVVTRLDAVAETLTRRLG